MLSNKAFCIVTISLSSVWFLLCSFAVQNIFSEHLASYLLLVYVSGFCQVGLGKYFFVKAYKEQKAFSKKEFAVLCCVFPTVLLSAVTIILLALRADTDITLTAVVIAMGTLLYNILFGFIEKRFFKK